MKFLVTGANGMLGKDLCKVFSQKHEVVPTDVKEMDVRDFNVVLRTVMSVKPDYILHLAAMTDVDSCETNMDGAFKINTIGTKNLALASQKWGVPMVYISTGSVFDGEKKEPYTEFDLPNPQSIYSKSKHEGELFIHRFLDRYFIIRPGWIFGGGKEDKKFVAKILELSLDRSELKIVDDKFGSPTYTKDLSRGILKLVDTGLYGTYHMVNSGCCSRFECAEKIFEYGGVKNCNLLPVSSEEFPLPAPRPRMEALRNYHLELINMNMMRSWQEALEDYVRELRA